MEARTWWAKRGTKKGLFVGGGNRKERGSLKGGGKSRRGCGFLRYNWHGRRMKESEKMSIGKGKKKRGRRMRRVTGMGGKEEREED